ncbi:ParD-like family protein [Acidovorax sp. LjRoot74]|uniref:ParD-like family protein n=1 Tax=Acidovorax sp. LjRoot74 TaxID=3342337 RepID=UPI003ECD23D3
MGIVKISDQMHENLRLASTALSRSINAQAEHWMRVGMLAELYPDLDHREICQMLVRAELAGGLDVALAARGELDSKPATSAAAVAPAARSRKQPH